jgi:carbon monoxide dehydrogenase subunit G
VELTHRFTVPASVDDAWAAFNDLERIAPCFPGAALSSYDGESFEGLVKVKLGPISLQYTGTGSFVERDEATHRAVIEAKGKDKRGNGTAAATITASLSSAGEAATDVTVNTDLSITGKPAQFGRGVLQDVSDKLLAQFASCLESKLGESSEPAAPARPSEPAAPDQPAEPAAAITTDDPASLGKTGPVDSPFGDKLGALSTGAGPAAASEPTVQLDIGATVLPVLLKRYAPRIAGAIIALWLLRRVLRRG